MTSETSRFRQPAPRGAPKLRRVLGSASPALGPARTQLTNPDQISIWINEREFSHAPRLFLHRGHARGASSRQTDPGAFSVYSLHVVHSPVALPIVLEWRELRVGKEMHAEIAPDQDRIATEFLWPPALCDKPEPLVELARFLEVSRREDGCCSAWIQSAFLLS